MAALASIVGARPSIVSRLVERLPARTPLLPVLVVLVVLQAVGLIAIAAFFVVELARNQATNTAGALFAAVVALVVGVGMLAAARGLHHGRRAARAPVLVAQLLMALVAVGPDGVVHGGLWYVGLALLVWALTVGGLLFAPAVSAVLEG